MTRIQYMLVDFEHCARNYGCKNKWHDPCLREVWCPAGGTVMYQDKTRSPTVLNDSGMAVAPDFLERNWRPFPMDGGAWWAAVHGVAKSHGNPLQCSCLENPGDGGASWAAVYGVAQSPTWLKRLSSSSSCTKSGMNVFFQLWHSVLLEKRKEHGFRSLFKTHVLNLLAFNYVPGTFLETRWMH